MQTLTPASITSPTLIDSAATMFSQRHDTDHLLAVNLNALFTDVDNAIQELRVLSFDHVIRPKPNIAYSFLTTLGSKNNLTACGAPNWIGQLLPHEYDYQRTTPDGYPIPLRTTSAGLTGSLPVLIGLAALTGFDYLGWKENHFCPF